MASILYIAQFFSVDSEPGGQGQRHYQHAKALVEDGHTVTIITGGGTTMRAAEKIAVNQGQLFQESFIQPGLRVLRINSTPMKRRSVLHRAFAYLEFSLKALMAGSYLRLIEGVKFGTVFGSSPPLLVALVAYLLSVLYRADFFMEVRDLWSQTMRENGFINNPWLIALNTGLESWLYRKSRKIIVLSPAFQQTIEQQTLGVSHKIVYLPNGADVEFYQAPRVWEGSFLRNTPEEAALFHVNYAGVFSDYTHLESVLEAAKMIQAKNPKIRFNLAGGGYQFEQLRLQAEALQLRNVVFWEALPKNKISKFIMEGDLSLINYRALPVFGQVLPNKLFDYLAAGRPILAAVVKGEISRVLKESRSGITVEPENVTALVDAILWFQHNPGRGLKMGIRGHFYGLQHFNRAIWIRRSLLSLFSRILPIEGARRIRAKASRPELVMESNTLVSKG